MGSGASTITSTTISTIPLVSTSRCQPYAVFHSEIEELEFTLLTIFQTEQWVKANRIIRDKLTYNMHFLCSPQYWTIPHYLVYYENEFVLYKLWKASKETMKLDEKDSNGITPLYYAIQYNNLPSVKFLLTHGCDLYRPINISLHSTDSIDSIDSTDSVKLTTRSIPNGIELAKLFPYSSVNKWFKTDEFLNLEVF